MVLWMLFGLVELLVCMSRVYVAAHFPHQVICGVISGGWMSLHCLTMVFFPFAFLSCITQEALIYHQINSCLLMPGIIVAEIFSRQQWIYNTSLQRYFSITLVLLVFAVGFYVSLKVVGVDLLWTLEKAQKWCVNPAWVLMDTTPFASLMRNMGTLFGLGLGLHSPLYTESKKSTSSPFRIGCIAISLVFLQLLDFLTFPSMNHTIFYILSFTKSVVALLVPTILVPRGLSMVLQVKKVEKAS